MKTILKYLVLLTLSVPVLAQTDPTQRIDKNLRSVGSKGLSDRNYTTTDSLKLAGLSSGGASSSAVTALQTGVTALSASVGTLSTTKLDLSTYTNNRNLDLFNLTGKLNINDTTSFTRKRTGYDLMSSAERSKLAGIATGATNVTDNSQIGNGRGYLDALTGVPVVTYNTNRTADQAATATAQATANTAVPTTTYTTNRTADQLATSNAQATAGQALAGVASLTPTVGLHTTQIATKQDKLSALSFSQLTTSRYLTDADNGKILYNNSGSTITLTVSNTLAQPFAVYLSQEGTGPVVVATAGGMVLQNTAGNNRTAGQWTMAQLTIRTGADVVLSGQTDLAAGDYLAFIDDNFTRANTTPPAGIGSPGTFSTPSVGSAWTDPSTTFKILNNTLTPGAGAGLTLQGPRRPASESLLNQGVSITTGPITSTATTNVPYQIELRQQTGDVYLAAILVSLNINTINQTGIVVIANSSGQGSFGGVNQPSFSVLLGHNYTLTAKAESLYSGGFTVLFYSVVDAAFPSTILSSGAVYLPFNTSMLVSVPGNAAIVQNRSDISRSDLATLTNFQLLKKTSLGLNTIQSGNLVASTSGNYVTVSGSGNWVAGSSSPIFTLSGAASSGATITSQVILSPKVARLQITTGAATGLLRITEGGTNNAVDVQIGALATSPIVPLNIVVQPSSTTANVKMSLGVITGGKAPYTVQWYRSTTWNFTPTSTELIAGATSPDLTNIPPDGQMYSYRCIVTDALSATAVTVPAPGIRGYTEKPATVYVPTTGKVLRIGYIGDSNLQNTSLGLVASFEATLTGTGSVTVAQSRNMAVGGSYSTQWLPGTANYNAAKASFTAVAGGLTHIVVLIGTNDAGSFGVPKATFINNLNSTVAQLATDFPGVKVVLMTPQLYLRSAAGDFNIAMIQYVDALDQVVAANSNCLRGDRFFMTYSYGRFDKYSDSIHLAASGYLDMSLYWADAFLRRIDGQ